MLAIAVVHCGSTREQGVTAAAAAGSSSSSAPGPDSSPFVPRSNDPICGGGHKWVGSRCVAGESEGPSAAEKKTASLARGKQSESLLVDEVTVGTGREVRSGDIVKLHYVGTLADGTTFDSSRSNGPPFEFRVGQGQVIKGFDRGVLGMKVGGRRKLTIPYQLGYGTEGSPPRIPPRATLIFDLELIDVM